MKKTTLLIFLVLILASGTGAYVFGEGFLDDIINDEQEEDTQITEEKPEIVLEDLIATIFVNNDFRINEYDM